MVINDKKFATMLDKKVKTGYQLMVRDDEVFISGAGWMLAGEMRELGRETLAVLVKHLGYVPRECCCRVNKFKEEYFVQGMVEEAFREEMEFFTVGEDLRKAAYTGLRLGLAPLYQTADKHILCVELLGGVLEVDSRIGNAVGEQSLCWMDDDSTVWFRAYRPGESSEEKPKWNALESIFWPQKALAE